jgi:hypothetical protein
MNVANENADEETAGGGGGASIRSSPDHDHAPASDHGSRPRRTSMWFPPLSSTTRHTASHAASSGHGSSTRSRTCLRRRDICSEDVRSTLRRARHFGRPEVRRFAKYGHFGRGLESLPRPSSIATRASRARPRPPAPAPRWRTRCSSP